MYNTQQIMNNGVGLFTKYLDKHKVKWSRDPDKRKSQIFIPSYEFPLITILVKSTLRSVPGGGKGKPELSWWCEQDRKADYIVTVDLDSSRMWIFRSDEFSKCAQQHPEDKDHLYMRLDNSIKPRTLDSQFLDSEFNKYLLKERINEIMGK